MTVTRTRLTHKAETVTESLRSVIEPCRVVLPFPPTLNLMRIPARGRLVTSPKYREWMEEAGLALLSQRPKKMLGRVGITVEVAPADKRRRDLDNVGFKAALDLLVKHGVIEGDDSRYVRSISAHWDDIAIEPRIVVTIKPAVF